MEEFEWVIERVMGREGEGYFQILVLITHHCITRETLADRHAGFARACVTCA